MMEGTDKGLETTSVLIITMRCHGTDSIGVVQATQIAALDIGSMCRQVGSH